jgi:hypothetical protein
LKAFGELTQDAVEVIDLGIGMGRRQLDPKADLVARDERIHRHRRVDAAIEEQVAHFVDAIGVR